VKNPILIGQAEEIDTLQPQVRAMLGKEGVYIGGDTKTPDLLVPLVSQGGRVFCLAIDHELAPDRFLSTLTLHGPYVPKPPAASNEHLHLLEKAHAAIDGLLAQLILADPTFRPTKSSYWTDMVAISDAIKQARGEQ
jgi:hypothetical protein